MEKAMQISEENTKKRRRESTPPSLDELPLYLTSLRNDDRYHAAHSLCDPELAMNFATPLLCFERRDILDEDSTDLLRADESYKKSWDVVTNFSISYDMIENGPKFTHCCPIAEREAWRERGKRYLSKAAEGHYFDAPPSHERPVELYEGFYILYPDGPDKDDPALKEQPHFAKFARLMLKLGQAAVAFHNFITGSDLDFPEIEKANLFFGRWSQSYFITLKAKDKKSDKMFKCQSRVICSVANNEWFVMNFKDEGVRLIGTHVESFRCVECSD